ncbi:hypothetical protein ACHAQH_000334 [Verticillium albo-atrum]
MGPSTSGQGTPDSPQVSEQQPTTSSRVSFGVELEFFVAWAYEDEADPDEDIASELSPLLRIPRDPEPNPQQTAVSIDKRDAETHVKDLVKETLARAGVPCRLWDTNLYPPDSIQNRQARCQPTEYITFSVVGECSLNEFKNMDGYRMIGVELVSPAMYDRDNSFDLIRLVVSTLTTNFRCRVNQSCGFHVHVGVGREKRIDPRTLRRFGALAWAASPLLSQLHAPDRAVNLWSQSVRDCLGTEISRADGTAAYIWSTADCLDWEEGESRRMTRVCARDRWLGETFEPEDEDDGDLCPSALTSEMGEPGRHWQDTLFMNPKPADPTDLPQQDPPSINYKIPVVEPPLPAPVTLSDDSAPPHPRHPPFKRRIPHVPLRPLPQTNPDIIARAEAWIDTFQARMPQSAKQATRRNVLSGVREVLAADMAGGLVGSLYDGMYKHTAYNFVNYSLETYDALVPPRPTTIELREAGGTLNPEWVCVWARIACRLLEWSRDACDADFFRVVRLLAWAQEEGGQYDVVDFLVDLNLLAEARYCEGRLERGAEAWFECLLFAPTKEQRRVGRNKRDEDRECQ